MASRIREAVAEDLEALVALDAAAFGRGPMRDSLASELSRSWARVLVAEDVPGDAAAAQLDPTPRDADAPAISPLVAYVAYWIVADEIHILNVATHPAHRRHGHARALVEAMASDARLRRSRVMLLEVRAGNLAATRLYASLGFVENGIRPRYYDDGEDARLMQREIAPTDD